MIDTKEIRIKLMTARRKDKPETDHDSYYDGVMDALWAVEQSIKSEETKP